MKIGIIDVGGGLRGSFGCGVMDRCLDDNINIDYGIGVSAGSANIISFFAGQRGRNYTFYTEYTFRKEYMSFGNYIRKHNYLDLDYIYSTLTNSDGENPLDFDAVTASGKEYYAVACNAVTGKPRYFTIGDGMEKDNYEALKASCCVPMAEQPYVVDGVPYVDGGLADPVPLKKALSDGCDKIILVLTKPRGHISHTKSYELSARWLNHKGYPMAAAAMRKKYIRYNKGFDQAVEMERHGTGLILAPKSIENMKTFKKDKGAIIDLYRQGYEEGGKVRQFIESSQS